MAIHFGSLKIQKLRVVVGDIVSYHGWKCLVYLGCVAIVILSIVLKICLDRTLSFGCVKSLVQRTVPKDFVVFSSWSSGDVRLWLTSECSK